MALLDRLLHPSRGRDAALLFLRVSFGFMFVLHGWPKMTGGAPTWTKVGSAMAGFGLDGGYAFFGFLATLAELGGGLCLMLGLLVRPVAVALVFTMLVATMKHVLAGDRFPSVSHAIEAGLVWLFFLLGGAGRYSVDAWLQRRRSGRR